MKKIAVIGAGIAGTTTAYALLKRGHKVTIFDYRRYPAMQQAMLMADNLAQVMLKPGIQQRM